MSPDVLTDGTWQPDKRGVLRWVDAWPTERLLTAHRRYERARVAGTVDQLDQTTRTGERTYQRRKKRARKAAA